MKRQLMIIAALFIVIMAAVLGCIKAVADTRAKETTSSKTGMISCGAAKP